MRLTPVLNILGILLAMLAGTMLVAMVADLAVGHHNWQAFAISALITGFVGVSLWIANNETAHLDLGLRQAFLLTNGAWISIFNKFFCIIPSTTTSSHRYSNK